jgi:hypothetical protein
MTHEELLNRIAQAGLEPYGNVMPTHLVLALRAVLELHKPQNKHEVEFGLAKCDGCYMPYPCPTIQAIDKELK